MPEDTSDQLVAEFATGTENFMKTATKAIKNAKVYFDLDPYKVNAEQVKTLESCTATISAMLRAFEDSNR